MENEDQRYSSKLHTGLEHEGDYECPCLGELFFTLIQCKLLKQSPQQLISPSPCAISVTDITASVMLYGLNTSRSLRSALYFWNAEKHIHACMPGPLEYRSAILEDLKTTIRTSHFANAQVTWVIHHRGSFDWRTGSFLHDEPEGLFVINLFMV